MNQNVNILLVDDQPGRLLSYEAILEGLGQNLVKATSGLEALRLLMDQEFAVILLDVSMPDMDGFETAAMIHQHPRFEKTPIIFVTALPQTDMDRLKAYQLGAVDYVLVPVVPEILRTKVSVLVELYTKRRELQELNRTLETANTELAQANSTLQAEKTRELERANAELESANQVLQMQIAERERLERVLREADKKKDEFLAILAHELRNPLAPIRNAVQMMRVKPLQDPELAWCRDAIDRQIELLVRLVDDLLDISRITQGKIKLQKTRADVASIVAQGIETLRGQIDARGQELVLELPDEACWIEGDVPRLAQVVGNLVSNASKYTDEGGTIRLRVEVEPGDAGASGRSGGGYAAIRVTDTGIGIPPEMLSTLFQLFAQVDSTIDRAQGGLGVGLALVRSLVEMHGGTVSAHSDGPGKGSEFVVRVPLSTSPVEPADAPAVGSVPRDGCRRVLVVDDNEDSAASMALLLQSVGHAASTANDGHAALEIAEQSRPEVVLLDLGMPGLDGYEVAKRLRSQPWGKDVLLIALTGWGQQEARDRSRTAGFDAHLVKPVEFDALLRIVNRSAGSSSAPTQVAGSFS
jgi:signal transduction histidine kinase